MRERGSVADPAWMENEAKKIVDSDKNGLIKEFRVLSAQDL